MTKFKEEIKPFLRFMSLFLIFFCLGYNAMRMLSETQGEKYRTLNINANMDDFYKAEEKSLYSQCNTLVKFIKFIHDENAEKLSHVSQAVLEIQNEY